ncbi:MAG: OmpA family protein [bacterium]|nr:OmpA family protein [bacterium]
MMVCKEKRLAGVFRSVCFALAAGASLPAFAIAPGSSIVNTARLVTPTQNVTATVSVHVASGISLLKYAQTPSATAVATPLYPVVCQAQSLSQPAFQSHVTGNLVPLPSTYLLDHGTVEYQVGEPVFVQVSDASRNLNPAALDTLSIVVSNGRGDNETLTLTETSVNSGEFSGFINTTSQPSVSGDCQLNEQKNDQVRATYADAEMATATLLDPYGVVFDSTSNTTLDGVRVRLVNADGSAAVVLGDGGEAYPNEIITGQPVVTGTLTYNFGPGEFRFPLIAPGTYRLEVDQLPAGYAAPTILNDAFFASGPYHVSGAGSRQGNFDVVAGPPARIDIPLDSSATGLFVVKTPGVTLAAVGDFVPYTVQVTNTQPASTFTSVHLHDRLPAGFRYKPGTLKLNGVTVPDPALSGDGLDLDVTLGNLAASASARITYITEVTAATRPGDAVNLAQAYSGTARSNAARATIAIREDLMRSRALLAGRVLSTDSCDAADMARAKPVQSARIYMENGRYVITDIRGRWHFDDVRPGTHVVQLDKNGLPANSEILACERNTRAAGNAQSQFVDVQGGTLWQADFYIRKNKPLHYVMAEQQEKVSLRLSSEATSHGLRFTLKVNNSTADLGSTRLQLELPAALHYVSGSFSVNGVARADQDGFVSLEKLPATADVFERQIALGDMVKSSSGNAISWDMTLDPQARVGNHYVRAVVKATVNGQPLELSVVENEVSVVLPEKLGRVIIFRPHFGSFSTTMTAADQKWLDDIADDLADAGDIRLDVVGHTDNVRVVPRAGRAINDNIALSAARAKSVADYLRSKLDLPADRIVASGKGPDEPMVDNKTAKGRDTNRRVELKVYAVAKTEAPRIEIKSADSGEKSAEWTHWSVADESGDSAGEADADKTAAASGQSEAATADTGSAETDAEEPVDAGMGLLSHHDGDVVANRIQALRVRVDSRLTADILLDGNPIPNDRLGFKKNEGKTSLMSFIGVDLGEPGVHAITIQGKDAFGNLRMNQTIKVTVAGEITRLRVAAGQENVSDGRTPVQLKVELIDGSGQVVPAAVDLRLVSGELRPLVTGDAQRTISESSGKVPVSADGMVHFAPVTRSGLYTIELAYGNILEKIPVYVRPEKRDWILVGLAEGSVMEKQLAGNMQSAAAAGSSDDLWQDGRVAFFAKGQVRGDWLLTMAYDSHKEGTNAFGGVINPTQYYTLYADASDPRYDAASKKRLYLRIEKDAFYALFGDLDAGMTVTELGRYNRSLTGFKSEYHDKHFDVNVFAADTSQGYIRDEQRGNGTSGLYKLRSNGILAGSDKIRIETRDRYKSEIILQSQQLARYGDYSIDYDRGEIFFKTPIASQDENFNPIWIVAEYEVPVSGGAALNAGGRAAVKLQDGRAVIGVTAVQQNAGINKSDLRGLDAEYRIDLANLIRAEVASSSTTSITSGAVSGNASLLEWKRDSQKIKSRVYYRETDAGFGLGQQNASEGGMRKMGAEGRYQLRHDLFVTADVFQQEMLNTGSHREIADVRSEYLHDAYSISAGLRHAQENIISPSTRTDTSADQLTLGGRYNINRELKLRANAEIGLAGQSTAQSFPDRLLVGADYQLLRNLQLTGEEEWAFSDSRSTQSTRAGVKYQPWKGASFNTSVDRQTSESGERLRSGLGLGQRLVLSPEWNVDLGYDRADTLKDNQAPAFNPAQPPVFGAATTSDFWAAYTGANYQRGDFKGVGRIERREASDSAQWNVVGGAYRELNDEMALAAGLTVTLAETQAGAIDDRSLLRGSLAWRQDPQRWMLLEQLDYGFDRHASAISNAIEGHRLVNNLNASKRWDADQLSVQYGAKFVFATIDSSRVNGYTDLMGLEWRHNITERWDVGVRSSALHSWGPAVMDYSYGISVGVTPMRNAWVSLGYNFEGVNDGDFTGAEYSAKGVYLKMRLKVDQDSLQQIWNDSRGVFGGGSAASAAHEPVHAEPVDNTTADLNVLAAPASVSEAGTSGEAALPILAGAATPAALTSVPVLVALPAAPLAAASLPAALPLPVKSGAVKKASGKNAAVKKAAPVTAAAVAVATVSAPQVSAADKALEKSRRERMLRNENKVQKLLKIKTPVSVEKTQAVVESERRRERQARLDRLQGNEKKVRSVLLARPVSPAG